MTIRPKFDVEPSVATPAGGTLIAVVGTPTAGQVPTYDGSKFVPQTPASGG